MLVKHFVQLQFCLDKTGKPQVMYYFRESNRIVKT